ncbi:MAG: sugar phosphate isomerase/epimerase family protein [Pseudomonadota bacterium]
MKLGVICDGINRDLGHALTLMAEFGLTHAELQFVGEKEVGDHSPAEIAEIARLVDDHGMTVSCLSRHVFAGLSAENRPGDAAHRRHMDGLKRVIAMAQALGGPLVRIMSSRKEQILWGAGGAETWNVAQGAWASLGPLIAPAVELAREEGVGLVIETGNGTMINSSYTARRLIDELQARDVLRVLWDPANACWCHEQPYPDGYAPLRGGHLGHIHIKDVVVDTPRAFLEVKALGEGQLAPHLAPIAAALRADCYDGAISLESVYHPGNGDFEAGFRASIARFKAIFG